MLFYRHKIILALLQEFGGNLEKIHLQKFLFLFSQEQAEKIYDFVPYNYGCFSYTANNDLLSMEQKEICSETDKHIVLNKQETNYFDLLKEADKKILLKIKKQFGNMSADDLMRHTYINYPYWATKSKKAKELLTKDEFQKIQSYIPKQDEITLLTIGYEGISLEEYFNRLIKSNVKVLIDVRSNAYSMKYGFSRHHLIKRCNELNIEYLHFSDVGIISEKRQELNTQSDYENLFAEYRKNVLAKTQNTQNKIIELLKQKRRIALTCFEKDINCCHRKHLAEKISQLPQFNYKLEHI